MKRFTGVIALIFMVLAISGLVALLATDWSLLESPRQLVGSSLEHFDTPANPTDSTPRVFTVHEGETATVIAERLGQQGLISNAMVFRLMAQGNGVSEDLAAGEYNVSPSMRPSEILAMLVAGKTRPVPMITIPEGWRAEEIAERLAANQITTVESFMKVVKAGRSRSPALASRPPGASLEGYLFPETHSITHDMTDQMIADRMVAEFEQRFDSSMREKAKQLGMSIHQVVTLASIIEREAVIPAERPVMASVFYNRLRAGMPLESDPTVQYAVASDNADSQKQFGWWKSHLTNEDLQEDSPYNTYKYPGLPPGPICDPGLPSLQAAVEPESTDYLYFVARPDGSHAFARTLEEHIENINRYR